jgi:ribosome recycling factor
MIENLKKETIKRMKKSLESLRHNFSKISTGRANPAMLDSLMIDVYGEKMKIDQVASVSVEGNKCLVINAWDKGVIVEIERAIMKSNLGLNPSTADTSIRLNIPPLTEESRANYSKKAKEEAENAKISIRNIRRDANQSLKKSCKDAEISESEDKSYQKVIQKLTDEYIVEIDKMYSSKHKDLISI